MRLWHCVNIIALRRLAAPADCYDEPRCNEPGIVDICNTNAETIYE